MIQGSILGQYITQGTITPIERSIAFADKFPDQILDKNQLQRFLGSVNYVLDFYPDINKLCKPLHDRLKKNPTKILQHLPQLPNSFRMNPKCK